MEDILVKINKYISLLLDNSKVIIFILKEKFGEFHISKLKELFKISEFEVDIYTYLKFLKDTNHNNPNFNDFRIIAKNFKYWELKNYNINLLDYHLSLPLLKKLVQIGDHKAKNVFVNQLSILLWRGDSIVLNYLIKEKYEDYIKLEIYKRKIHYPKSICEIKFTLFLCIINIIIFLIFKNFQLNEYFVLNRSKIFENFEIWRIITSLFTNIESTLYSENTYIFVNILLLLVIGAFFESNNIFSLKTYLAIYLLSGLIGNVALLIDTSSNIYTAAGLSGCTFGLMGAFIIIILNKKRYFSLMMIIIFSTILIYESFLPGIAYLAHIIGFISGFIINSIIYIYYFRFHN